MIEDYINNNKTIFNSIPAIIAEAGVNHECSIEIAKTLIREAAEGGADAIKFQTYRAHTLASKNSPSYWDRKKEPTKSQHELFSKYDKFWKKEFEILKKECDKENIEFLSTPFDSEAAEFLNDLMNVYKISSSDLTNHPFIDHICSFNKPIILSTGASHLWEIQETVDLIEKKQNPLCLMHCVLNYPTEDQSASLGKIIGLKNKFPDHQIGYSDHTLPLNDLESVFISYLLGAKIIEKHFTHDKSLPGNDHYHAMDKYDLRKIRNRFENARTLLGHSKEIKISNNQDQARKNARRSLVLKNKMSKNQIFSSKNLTWKRPGTGISPKFINEIIGKKALRNIQKDELLSWSDISFED